MTGDYRRFGTGDHASAKVLAIRGKVLPATLTDVSLWAKLADGRIIEGESKITEAMGQIRQIGCHPADPVALPAALAAIKEADYIIIGRELFIPVLSLICWFPQFVRPWHG
jgi:uncharacterized cofD-like protein